MAWQWTSIIGGHSPKRPSNVFRSPWFIKSLTLLIAGAAIVFILAPLMPNLKWWQRAFAYMAVPTFALAVGQAIFISRFKTIRSSFVPVSWFAVIIVASFTKAATDFLAFFLYWYIPLSLGYRLIVIGVTTVLCSFISSAPFLIFAAMQRDAFRKHGIVTVRYMDRVYPIALLGQFLIWLSFSIELALEQFIPMSVYLPFAVIIPWVFYTFGQTLDMLEAQRSDGIGT